MLKLTPDSKEKCRCGHSPDHAWVSEQAVYSIPGWLLICCGVSALPKEVVIKCDKCGFVFQRSDDLELRKTKQF